MSVSVQLLIMLVSRSLTSQPAIKIRVGRYFEARMRHQEAADVGEAGVDVLPYVL